MGNAFGTKIVTVPTGNVITGQLAIADVTAAAAQLTANNTPLTHGVFLSVKAADDIIYVGLAGVTQATGLAVHAGDNVFIPCNDASLLYIDAAVNGDAVTFLAV